MAMIKKTTNKRGTKKPVVRMFVEGCGQQYEITDIAERISEIYKESFPDEKVVSMDLYCNTEEGAVYYVVNGEGGSDRKIEL